MPNRIIREGILRSRRVDELSDQAELFYRRLMSVVDDYGCCEAHPSLLRADLYPLRINRVSDEDIICWLEECTQGNQPLIEIYEANGERYLRITGFRQRLRTMKAKFPAPKDTSDDGQTDDSQKTDERPPRIRIRNGSGNESETEGSEREPIPIMQPSELGIEGWDELVEVAAKAGMSLDPDPASDLCQKVWRYRDWENRRKCIRGIVERVECGQYSLDEREYIPTLENYVQKNQWRPSLRPKARGQPGNKKQATREQFDRLVMRDLEDADQQKIHSR